MASPILRGVIGAAGSQRVARDRLVVCDVAMFYGARSGGIRTYLDEKARFARRTGEIEHHVVVPGRRERHRDGLHELRSLELAASNGYRIPFGAGALKETLRAVRPDVVILHDPFWRPGEVTRVAHRLGARVVAVHHASPALNAAGLPGPDAIYVPLLRRIYRRAYERVDAVMSVVDPSPDAGRAATIPLRFGLDPAFRPAPAARGDHLLYVGRVAHDKRLPDLLVAMAAAAWRRPLWIVGDARRAARWSRARSASAWRATSASSRSSATASASPRCTARRRASSTPAPTRRSASSSSRRRRAARASSRPRRRRRRTWPRRSSTCSPRRTRATWAARSSARSRRRATAPRRPRCRPAEVFAAERADLERLLG